MTNLERDGIEKLYNATLVCKAKQSHTVLCIQSLTGSTQNSV